MSVGRRGWIDFGLFLAVLILIVWQLFIPPALSVANNNDFSKLAGRVCLGPAPVSGGPTLFDYAVLHWRFSPENCVSWPFRTTAELPLRAAVALNRLFHSPTQLDLRYMGAIYSLIFLVGFVTLQRALRPAPLRAAVIAQCLWILVTCNAVYLPLFNTFYFDALTMATITGALASVSVVGLRKNVTTGWLLGAGFWLVLLAGSKSQHAILAVVLGAALWVGAASGGFRSIALRALMTASILAAAWLPLATLPQGYAGEAVFNAFFYRILPSAPDPEAYLRETRIPVSWVRYVGTQAYAPGSPLENPDEHARFGGRLAAADLIRLYLRHPSAAWVIARVNLEEGSLDRVLRVKTDYRLSNYDRSAGKPPQTLSQFFAWWSLAKHALIAERPYVYLAYILSAVALAWVLAPPLKRLPVLLFLATLALGVEWAISMLDGLDANRHLTVFNYLLDLFVCADIVFAAWNRIAPAHSSRTVAGNVTAPVTMPHCADIRQ